MSRFGLLTLIAALIGTSLFSNTAFAAKLVTGFCVNSQRVKADREKVLNQLQSESVHIVRTAFAGRAPEDWNIDFAKSAYDRGIRLVLIVFPINPPDTGTALSGANPELSRQYFESILSRLDAKGVQLEALELGNEINFSGPNGDIPPAGQGQGKTFNYLDLSTNPEGRKIAKGFLQYLKILEVLKDVRDHSSVNKQTPILTAGFTDFNSEWPTPKMKMDAVTLAATVWYLRQHGLDHLVDGYAVHRYPRDKTPALRKARLEKAVSVFQPEGTAARKPLWITEWGVENQDRNCPSREEKRIQLVRETMKDLDELAAKGRVAVAIYYRWDSYPVSNFDPASVVRCGHLTESGKLVVRH